MGTKKIQFIKGMSIMVGGPNRDVKTFLPGDIYDIKENICETLVSDGRAKYVHEETELSGKNGKENSAEKVIVDETEKKKKGNKPSKKIKKDDYEKKVIVNETDKK